MHTFFRNDRRPPASRLLLACVGLAIVSSLTACAGVAGVGFPVSTSNTTGPSTIQRTTTTGPTSAGVTPSTPPTTPGCADHPHPVQATPNTPTGAPLITMTSGANAWIANGLTEPLSLALYPDGTGITADAVGEQSKPLTTMRIGFVPTCTLGWAEQEIVALSEVDMGEPQVTDQGTTTLTYQPAGRADIKISAYALGVGEEYVDGDSKENRVRFRALIAAVASSLTDVKAWTPDRLRVVAVPAPVESAGEALVWPAKTTMSGALPDRWRGARCGVVTGATVSKVIEVLSDNRVHYRWSIGGTITGLSIGPLVPGQQGCEA